MGDREGNLTLATLASVAASVTTVGCMTLCTARLNIGSTRFREPFNVELVAEVFDDKLDFSELERLSIGPAGGSSSISLSSEDDKRVGLSEWPAFDTEDELISTT